MTSEVIKPVSGDELLFLDKESRYDLKVVHSLESGKYYIALWDNSDECFTQALSYRQRALQGRVRAVKDYSRFPVKELEKLGITEIPCVILSGNL